MAGRGGRAARVRGAAAPGWALAGALALTGCGGAAAHPGAGSSEVPATSEPAVWPVDELTVLVPASGPGTPVTEAERRDLAASSEQLGLSAEEAVEVYGHQDDFMLYVERVRARFSDTFASTAFTSAEGDAAWVAFTGTVSPEAVELTRGLPLDVELRGGSLLSDAEREAAMAPGLDAFTADVAPVGGWSAGLDVPTATFTIDYLPTGSKVPDATTTAAVVAAAQAAIGREVPFRVEYVPDETDPETTVPAVWFLPAGFVADPAATSVEVLVGEQGCTSGQGAGGNTAEPVVEVTDGEVRIAVSTYVRLGPQGCPGHPLAPVVVELGQPLGDRTLVDVFGSIDGDPASAQGRWGDVVVPLAAPAAEG